MRNSTPLGPYSRTAQGPMVAPGGVASRERVTPVAPQYPAGVLTLLAASLSPRWTLNPQPSTLNPQPSTLNPQPSTLSPQPSTLNPQPSTLNPQPSTPTLNPQPSTLNPQPSTLSPVC